MEYHTCAQVGCSALLLLMSVLVSCAGQNHVNRDRDTLITEDITPFIEDVRVIEALRSVPREAFSLNEFKNLAYENHPLPIGYGQTISQPLIVARMTEALQIKPNDRILEIGTGSGYQAAVLSRLCKEVFSIEIIEELANKARRQLHAHGFDNITVIHGDGYKGLSDYAPFDGIIVTAAPKSLPTKLLSQLKDGGRLVIPVGQESQRLKVFTKIGEQIEESDLGLVRFVPMVGGRE